MYVKRFLIIIILMLQLNKRKRLLWCKEQLKYNEEFTDVIITDESSVQLEQHSRICFRKQSQPRKLKPLPKHPLKLHIWGGIASRGATRVIMFSGIMNAEKLKLIFTACASLLPFIQEKFPDGHKLFQDKDPKHASSAIEEFFGRNNVEWWPSPPESPDLNPDRKCVGFNETILENCYLGTLKN